jgi:hypothetical protein
MGAGIGFCLAIVLISGPLNQHYQAEMNRITNNSNLVCFDVSTLKKTTGNNTQDFIVLNKLTAAEWCNARDAMKVVSPLIYTMNTSALG